MGSLSELEAGKCSVCTHTSEEQQRTPPEGLEHKLNFTLLALSPGHTKSVLLFQVCPAHCDMGSSFIFQFTSKLGGSHQTLNGGGGTAWRHGVKTGSSRTCCANTRTVKAGNLID